MRYLIAFLVLCLVATTIADFECKKDVPYIENDCNRCHCSGKHLGCTLMFCTGGRSDEMRHCEVGTEWKDKCNDCWCVKDVGTICTNNPC